jgi:hypothetical protein
VIDWPAQEGICGLNAKGQVYRVPLSELDKATVFPPDSWEQFQNYLDYKEYGNAPH